MLSKPDAGWSDFQLEGTSVYTLSYLDDIAFDWIEQAIHGLKTLLPFCVKGFLEPNRFLCIVSYWNCHIVCEYDEREPFDEQYVINEMSHTSMIQFCQYLYDDVKKYIDEWSEFVSYGDFDIKKKKQKLEQLLDELKTLIAEKNKYFDEDRGFL